MHSLMLTKPSNTAHLDGPCRIHVKPARTGQLVLKAQRVMLTLIPSDLSAISSDFEMFDP